MSATTGYVVFFGSNLIVWRSEKQLMVSRSSTETNYRGIAYTVAKTIQIRKELADIRIVLSTLTCVMCNNINATYLAMNPSHLYRSKPIVVDYHFVRERATNVDVVVCQVFTKFQLTDIFTKGLSSSQFLF